MNPDFPRFDQTAIEAFLVVSEGGVAGGIFELELQFDRIHIITNCGFFNPLDTLLPFSSLCGPVVTHGTDGPVVTAANPGLSGKVALNVGVSGSALQYRLSNRGRRGAVPKNCCNAPSVAPERVRRGTGDSCRRHYKRDVEGEPKWSWKLDALIYWVSRSYYVRFHNRRDSRRTHDLAERSRHNG
jgi:hypothetical protein